MAAMMATASVHGETLGEPSARLRAMMEGTPVRLFTPFLSLQSAVVAELWRTHIGIGGSSRRVIPSPVGA